MCGICGIYRFDGGPVELEQLRAMTGRMVHRGPDDEGYCHSGPAGFGIRRLSIIDVKGGHQPLTNEDGTLWVVMNGEIYNHVELRAELEQKGHQFCSFSDTETLVHLYEEEGTKAVHRLNGMFAFALYDTKKHSVWIARDRVGIKPLFYIETPQSLLFASDLDALVGVMSTRQVDATAFLGYLALAYVPGPGTVYKGIKKLPPGHWLWVGPKGIQMEQYWDLASFQSWGGTEEEACIQLCELLKDAVHLQLRSDVPVGVFLSGGVDSSAVAVLAAGETDNALQTFTVDFTGKTSTDVVFARHIATKLGTRHKEVALSSADASLWLDELMPFIDEPIADSALIPSYVLSKSARAEGIKVLLTGAGGDELFGGYRRHCRPRLGSAIWIAEMVPSPWRSGVSYLIALLDKDRGMQVKDPRIAFGVGISGVSLATCFRLLKRRTDFEEMLGCLCEEFNGLSPNGGGLGYGYSRMYLDLHRYLVGDILALLDKSTMACSVEGRVPLLDHRLIEFAFALPESMNLLGGKSKGLFRKALSQILLEPVLHREKEGFNAPMDLLAIEVFATRMEEELLASPIHLFDELLDVSDLWAIVEDRRRRRAVSETIFSLYVFSRWYRTHVEKG